jgi:hypothetical protein
MRLYPDFLYAALETSACAAFFTESRMRLMDSNKLHRKSGSLMKAAHAVGFSAAYRKSGLWVLKFVVYVVQP